MPFGEIPRSERARSGEARQGLIVIWCARQDLNLRSAGSKGNNCPYLFQTHAANSKEILKLSNPFFRSVGVGWQQFTDRTRTIKPYKFSLAETLAR